MHDAKVESEITIGTSPQRVWNFLTDPNKIPLAMPSLIGNYNVPELPLKVGSKFNYKYQMFGIILEGEVTVDTFNEPSIYEFSTSGDVQSNWTYTLDGTENSTKLRLSATYVTPESVTAKLKSKIIAKMNQKESELYLENLKTVLEMQSE